MLMGESDPAEPSAERSPPTEPTPAPELNGRPHALPNGRIRILRYRRAAGAAGKG